MSKDSPTAQEVETPEFANPLRFEVSDGKGGSKSVTLDGDELIPVPRALVARAANNLEASHQRGMFQALSVTEAHAVLGSIVDLKRLAVEEVK